MPKIKLNISTVKKLSIFILIGLFLFWFVGWKSIRFDENDKEIGKNIIFNVQMLHVTNIPDNMAGEIIADKYDAILRDEESWKDFSSYFPEVIVDKIECNETFYVKNVFYTERHGFIMKGLGPSVKYYVLSSSKYKDLVIYRGDYERYSEKSDSIRDDCLYR